uniref:hypothetical protein n=1 Tax=Algoriphagus sp. TaxID=1872435 RepID=UPI0025905033|nr:hypothetical protein [Algoriphagus sp.]
MTAIDKLIEEMQRFELPVLNHQENQIETQAGYIIEVERLGLYKLIHLGDVIAPFDDLEELCLFIKTYS